MITLVKYPKRSKGLLVALLLSLVVHVAAIVYVRNATFFSLALGLREIEFVDEEYDRAILIDFSKKFTYPPGYMGFRPPEKVRSLEELKKEQERRARLEAARRERRQREEERRKREAEELAKREAEEKARAEEQAKAAEQAKQKDIAIAEAKPTPTPTPPASPTPHPDGYGRFGKINTAPIKAQVQRLYEAKKAGKLVLPEGKLRVGVEGTIAADGTIANYRISVSSGNEEIDEAAKAILSAVSASRALGVLNALTSLSLVLDIDQNAELRVVGFASTEQDAIDIANLAQVALFAARMKKAGDETAMVMLNNLKIKRDGSRINATISVPRQLASDTLANSMNKGQAPVKQIHDQLFEFEK